MYQAKMSPSATSKLACDKQYKERANGPLPAAKTTKRQKQRRGVTKRKMERSKDPSKNNGDLLVT